MKKEFKVGVVLLIGVLISGMLLYAKKEKIDSKTYTLSDFSKIKLIGDGEVVISQTQDKNKVEISGPSYLLNQVSVEIQDKKCIILKHSNYSWFNRLMRLFLREKPVVYYIHVKNLESISAIGAFNFKEVNFKSKNLKLNFRGAHRLFADFDLDTLRLNYSGSVAIALDGYIKNQFINGAGAIDYYAEKVESANVVLIISGAGEIKLGNVKKIEKNIPPFSVALSYHGTPKITAITSK